MNGPEPVELHRPAGGTFPTPDHDPDRRDLERDRLVHETVHRTLHGVRIHNLAEQRVHASRVARNVCDVLGIPHDGFPPPAAQRPAS